MIGKWHLGSQFPTSLGFDSFFGKWRNIHPFLPSLPAYVYNTLGLLNCNNSYRNRLAGWQRQIDWLYQVRTKPSTHMSRPDIQSQHRKKHNLGWSVSQPDRKHLGLAEKKQGWKMDAFSRVRLLFSSQEFVPWFKRCVDFLCSLCSCTSPCMSN